MAIQTGLNTRLYVEGYDLSGDANSLDGAGYSQTLLDTTALNTEAMSRTTGLVEGTISFNGFFNNATGQSHPVLSSNSGKLPADDQIVLIPLGADVGDPFAGLVSKEGEYNVSRGSGSVITLTATYASEGIGTEFGDMLTAHEDTHSSAGSGTVLDGGASSSNGASGYCQIFSLASGTVTVKIQHATSSGGTYSDLISFTATGTGAVPMAERGTASGTVNRYVKVTTTGTFSNAVIAVGLHRL
tara:strand:+ start:2607 stop:3335 length:729 start_codon:yes stop_codon:yes gene_type:complete